jgi:predicted nucleic acid-binding protein
VIKVFLDTNVFLDLFLNREKFADAAEVILSWCQEGKIEGHTSGTNIANIYYLVNQQKTKAETKKIVRKLLEFIWILATTRKDLLLAVESDFIDFEDAIQYYSALNIDGLNFIITRNKKDYKASTVTVVTSEEFVKLHT